VSQSTTKNLKLNKMKVQITKMQKVEVPTEYQKEEGCVAFQLVKVVIDFYGKLIEDVLDTKILQDGRQIVTNGNGYIKAGYEI
jgi:hypothetical protein